MILYWIRKIRKSYTVKVNHVKSLRMKIPSKHSVNIFMLCWANLPIASSVYWKRTVAGASTLLNSIKMHNNGLGHELLQREWEMWCCKWSTQLPHWDTLGIYLVRMFTHHTIVDGKRHDLIGDNAKISMYNLLQVGNG